MKHATGKALERLEPLLKRLRRVDGLKEKSPGTFYRGSRAFLHFHDDGAAFYADVRLRAEFERLPATTPAQQTALLKKIDTTLGKMVKPKR